MTTFGNKSLVKTSINYSCENCNYHTSRKYNFTLHVQSIKHKGNENHENSNNLLAETSKTYNCIDCSKTFKDRTGLWRHNKKCQNAKKSENKNNIEPSDKELITMLIKDNSELRNLMMKVIENGTNNNNTITTTNTNSNNKAFNLNFFLNETCKNAMNITDFVDSIKLQLSDLIVIGDIGYVEGISKIIMKNLNDLDETERPIHCTDEKRETIYIKDEDTWEKEDEERKKIKNTIKKVANKNIRLLPQFKEKYPDYNDSDSIYSDQYSKIVIEAMGGNDGNPKEKEDKIIRNISKVTTIPK
jgi:hypothetical protein